MNIVTILATTEGPFHELVLDGRRYFAGVIVEHESIEINTPGYSKKPIPVLIEEPIESKIEDIAYLQKPVVALFVGNMTNAEIPLRGVRFQYWLKVTNYEIYKNAVTRYDVVQSIFKKIDQITIDMKKELEERSKAIYGERVEHGEDTIEF